MCYLIILPSVCLAGNETHLTAVSEPSNASEMSEVPSWKPRKIRVSRGQDGGVGSQDETRNPGEDRTDGKAAPQDVPRVTESSVKGSRSSTEIVQKTEKAREEERHRHHKSHHKKHKRVKEDERRHSKRPRYDDGDVEAGGYGDSKGTSSGKASEARCVDVNGEDAMSDDSIPPPADDFYGRWEQCKHEFEDVEQDMSPSSGKKKHKKHKEKKKHKKEKRKDIDKKRQEIREHRSRHESADSKSKLSEYKTNDRKQNVQQDTTEKDCSQKSGHCDTQHSAGPRPVTDTDTPDVCVIIRSADKQGEELEVSSSCGMSADVQKPNAKSICDVKDIPTPLTKDNDKSVELPRVPSSSKRHFATLPTPRPTLSWNDPDPNVDDPAEETGTATVAETPGKAGVSDLEKHVKQLSDRIVKRTTQHVRQLDVASLARGNAAVSIGHPQPVITTKDVKSVSDMSAGPSKVESNSSKGTQPVDHASEPSQPSPTDATKDSQATDIKNVKPPLLMGKQKLKLGIKISQTSAERIASGLAGDGDGKKTSMEEGEVTYRKFINILMFSIFETKPCSQRLIFMVCPGLVSFLVT